MTDSELIVLAKQCGFTHAVALDPATLEVRAEVRDMCAANTCGQYAKRWSCPPGCGSPEDCTTLLRKYARGILVQTVGELEDAYDGEGMMETEALHKQNFSHMHRALRETDMHALALGAGCCTLCKTCTYPDAPCRFPEEKTASMEAFGLLVLEVCKANGLPYYYGTNTIAYTSCFLYK